MHPDAGAGTGELERFKEMTLAYGARSDHRTRRDSEAVRAGSLPRPRAYAEAEVAFVPGGAPPRFRAAQPKPLGWTPRRAWISFIGGLLVTLLGIAMSCF